MDERALTKHWTSTTEGKTVFFQTAGFKPIQPAGQSRYLVGYRAASSGGMVGGGRRCLVACS